MIVLGLTGGIASGKSTVSKCLERHGARLLDADRVARTVVEPGMPAWGEIRREFGGGFFFADGALDRKKMATLVFQDAEARARLNRIIHPRVIAEENRLIEQWRGNEPGSVLVLDAALLIETGSIRRVDRVLVVYVETEVQIHRLMGRDRLSREEAMVRLAAQMPLKEKLAYADYIVDTSGSFESTYCQVGEIAEVLRKLAAIVEKN